MSTTIHEIHGLSSLEDVRRNARSEGKAVLLDFFNPQWIGCQQMDAVTYPDPKVIASVEHHLEPVKVPILSQPLPQQFKVKWTPTLVLVDAEGEEHHRTVGFLPPDQLIPSLMLGLANAHFDHERFGEALSSLDGPLKEYPQSNAAPEAIYYQGVSRYKADHDAGALKGAYQALQKRYPQSEWTSRASVYGSL